MDAGATVNDRAATHSPAAIWRLGSDALRGFRTGSFVIAHALAARHSDDYGRLVTPARFVTDTSLGFLARRLLFIGYDVQVVPGARLEELFAAARREGRIVLTLSTRHPKAFADVAAIVVPREDVATALRSITAAHAPVSEPFSRCPACNQLLQTRHAMEARGEVPGRVLRMPGPLRFCPNCSKWYWEGSHVARLREWLERTLRA